MDNNETQKIPAPDRKESRMLQPIRRRRSLWMLPLVLGVVLGVGALPLMRSRGASALDPQFGMVCASGTSFQLRATAGYISTPDGNSLLMWSYANDTGGTGAFQFPGPNLCVNQNDTVSITLTNDLPDSVSIIFPGQQDVMADTGGGPVLAQPEFVASTLTSLTNSVAPGGSITYSFVASEPGTYIYESGTEPGKQVQMGLIGSLIVRPALGAQYAYNDYATQFNPAREFLLLFHEVDPILHQSVEAGQPYDVTKLHMRYWTINGRNLPDTFAANNAPWLPSQPYGSLISVEPYDPGSNPDPALVRIANAGMETHPFHPHANSVRLIGQDGREMIGPSGEDLSSEEFSPQVAPGQTYDSLFKWTDVNQFNSVTSPVPVQIPGLQNLVFKDGVTYYAGSPYLGEQGELPVGTTSFNQCGEQYFPWHSHALNEFTNFNEGFGGLGTMLRVDPPGGCP